MHAYQVINNLGATSSTNDKKRIVKEAWESQCYEFFIGAQLAYDKGTPFYLKKIPSVELDGTENNKELYGDGSYHFDNFLTLAQNLTRRLVTGKKAEALVVEHIEAAPSLIWNIWYRPILMKDLRVGVTSTIINNVLDDIGGEAIRYKVPERNCMGGQPIKDHLKKVVGAHYVDPKLDGTRIFSLLNKDDNTVRLFSRNGLLIDNFPHIEDQLLKLLANIPGSIVLEGEMVGESFAELMTQFRRKYDADSSDMKYALFDVVPYDDFHAGESKMTQEERTRVLVDGINPLVHDLESIWVVPKRVIDFTSIVEVWKKHFPDEELPDVKDSAEVLESVLSRAASVNESWAAFAEMQKEAIEAGYEGLMIKGLQYGYVCKKRNNWLKWKPHIEVDLVITEVLAGEAGKKNEHTLGSFICAGTDPEFGYEVNTNVPGFTDAEREEFWAIKDQLIGQVVTITADAFTQNKEFAGTNKRSLRFPKFKCFRSIERKAGVKD